MRLTVLGCSGTFPGAHSGCSSYLVEEDGFRLLLDMGNNATGALQRHAPLFGVDAVFITHAHADHCIDLVAYSYARRYVPPGFEPTPEPLPVYAPAGMHDRLMRCYEHEPEDRLGSVYSFREVRGGQVLDVGPFRLDLARVEHPVECNAVRLSSGGRSLTYSGDTGESGALVELARGTDLALLEASWYDGDDNPPGVHLTAGQAGAHAARADAGRLLLTHLTPWCDPDRSAEEAARAYSGAMTVASAGAVIDV